MSLIHWWPLTEDLNDKIGLTTLNAVIEENIINANGKIGQYCKLNNNCLYIINPFKNLNNWSLAFWMRDDGLTAWQDFLCFEGNLNRLELSNQGKWQWYNSYATDPGSGNFLGTSITLTPAAPAKNTWYHIVLVKKGSKASIYKDGKLLYSDNNAQTFIDTAIEASKNYKLYFNCRADTGYGKMSLNDIRCYDHALSLAEIQELKKALVVHYTFNDGFTNNICDWRTISNIKTSGWQESKSYDGECLTLTAINGWRCFMWDIGSNNVGSPITFSFEYKITDTSNAGYIYVQNMSSVGYGGALLTLDLNTTDWTKATVNISSATQYIGFNIRGVDQTGLNLTMQVKNIKIALNDFDDQYSEYNVNYEIPDDSGYNHNAIFYNSSISNDTASGSLSCHTPRINPANTNSSVTTTNSAFVYADVFGYNHTPTEFTVAWWWKVMDWGYGTGPFGLVIGNGDYMDSTLGVHDGSVYVNFAGGNTRVPRGFTGGGTGKWTHFAITFKPGSYTSYINGVSQGTSATDASLTLDPWRYIYLGAGCAGGVLRDGDIYWSDFRYYASCLSPEEIKDLYNCGGRISNLGDALTGSFIEGMAATKVNKNHTITTKELYEQILPDGYQQLEYIENQNTAYINTGIEAKANITKLETHHQRTANDNIQILFGSYDGVHPNYFYQKESATTYCRTNWRNVALHNTDAVLSVNEDIYGTLTIQNNVITFETNGHIVSNSNLGANASSSTQKYYLFGYNNQGTYRSDYACRCKLYSFKIWVDNNLVRDFIPTRNPAGILGLYDIINNQFYTNAGSGNFIAGPAITTGQASMLRNGGLTAREIIEI